MFDSNHGSVAAVSTFRRIVISAILLFVFIAALGAGYFYSYISSPFPGDLKNGEESVVVTIPKGSSVKTIGEILGENRVIRNDIRFLVLAKLSGSATKLQAGEFRVPLGKKPGEILQFLAEAKQVTYSVTIPEGLTAAEIAERFAEDGWCDSGRFMEIVRSEEAIKDFALGSGKTLEGFLYPDTYLLTKEIRGAEKIIPLLLHRFKEVWGEETAGIDPPPDVDRTVTLASIVEKETADPTERPLIAGVFLNRLQRGMRLQSDPTVVYAAEDYAGVITKKHLRTVTPYNTYIIAGLPAGPICNPGRDAIAAVLHPEESSSLYFVSRNDGTHQFSDTLAAHNRAVQKYQRKKIEKKGNK